MISLSLLGILAAAVGIVLRYVYMSWEEDRKLAHIPTHVFKEGGDHPKRYLTELKDLLESGHRQYSVHGQPFKVRIPIGGYSVKYRVILPKDHLEEIKHLSNNIFSWQLASRIIFAQDYTGAPDRGSWSGKALRVGIHQNLHDITTDTDKALSDIFTSELPEQANASLSIPMMDFFVRVVGSVTNAKLVDPRLANSPKWIRESCNFAISRYAAADEVRAYPPVISKLVARFLPNVKRLRESRAYNKEMMEPLYEDLRTRSRLSGGSKESLRKGGLGYQWLWAGAPDDVSLDDFSDTMMRTLIASIHTTAKTLTVAFIDLLTQPEYYNELQEEAREAVDPDGRNVQLDKLFKLDCFLKESQRLTPVFLRKSILRLIELPSKPKTDLIPSNDESHRDTGLLLQMCQHYPPTKLHGKRCLGRHRHRPDRLLRPQHLRRPPLPSHARRE